MGVFTGKNPAYRDQRICKITVNIEADQGLRIVATGKLLIQQMLN